MNAMTAIPESLGGPALTAQTCSCRVCADQPADVVEALDQALRLGLDAEALAKVVNADAIEVERHRSARGLTSLPAEIAAGDDPRWRRVRVDAANDELLAVMTSLGLRLSEKVTISGAPPTVRVGRATAGGRIPETVSACIKQREADLLEAIRRRDERERQARLSALRRLRNLVASPARRARIRAQWQRDRAAVLKRLRQAEAELVLALDMALRASAAGNDAGAEAAIRHLAVVVRDRWLTPAVVVLKNDEPVFQRDAAGRPILVGRPPFAKE